MKVGYARVSTFDQNLDVQIEALKKAGCEKIFSEQVSAVDERANRKELEAALDYVREGDEFIVTRIDRAARSIRNLTEMLALLKKKDVIFRATEQAFDMKTPEGKMMMNMLGVVAEFETDLRKERQMEGIAKAKGKGKYKGAKKKIDREKVWQLMDEGKTLREISREMQIGIASVSRISKERAGDE